MTLKAYLDAKGLTQAVFAARCGTTHSTISRLMAGRFSPTLKLAAAIERETAGTVSATSWVPDNQAHAA